ncbi:MAG: DUF559 domain-containing protein [Acidimicrobiia bacterium]|nr:DUF559 domain-containing protein [Acidimicrobiia bacterium]
MKYDKVVRDLALSQHAVVARRQLAAAGMDTKAIRRRVQSGMLEPVTSRVLRLSGAPSSPSQRPMIAVLHVGPESYISHQTAAAWWGLAGFRLDKIHVSLERVFHWTEDAREVVVHHSTVIPEWCRKIHKGIPIVSPALAVYQMAGSLSPERTAQALDSGWSLRLFDGRTIDALIARLARHGRNGTVLMRQLRRDRPDSWVPPASNLESRFDNIAKIHGFSFRRQVDVGDEEWSGRVDFLAEDCPLIVEILSERYHRALSDREADADRRQRHEALGFVVVEVWDHEIFYTPWVAISRIRKARERLLNGSLALDGAESDPST